MTKKLIALLLMLMLSVACAFAEGDAPEATETPAATAEPQETPAPACPPHELVELYRTSATCQTDGSVTRQCTKCGTLVIEALPATGTHRWADQGENHACPDCGLSAPHDFIESGAGHFCGDCGAYGEHNYVSLGARQHACVQCSAVGEHVIPEGSHACALCSYKTAHEYAEDDPHTCTICGEKTEHDYSGENPHVCTICGETTPHEYAEGDPHTCVVCGEKTAHDFSSDPHVCSICGEKTEHDFSGDDPHTCTICGYETEHDFSGEDPHRCTVCGARSDHNWERLTVRDGGLYQPTTTSYQCSVCGVVIEKTAEPEGNPLDTDSACLSISDEDGYLVLSEEDAGQLIAAGQGMTFTVTLDDPALYFAAPVSGGVAEGIGLIAEGGLAGLNVFLANARILESGALQLTLIATEARMNQPLPEEAGRVLLALPVAGLDEGVLTSARCACGEAVVIVMIGTPAGVIDETDETDEADEALDRAGVGVTDYRIARDWVRMAADGRLWNVRLGSFTYSPVDGGNPETRVQRPLILDGRLTFVE